MSENIENTVVKKDNSLKGLLNSPDIKERIQEVLGDKASTFATSVLQITSQNAMLKNAVPSSIVGAAMTSATLNLPLNNNLGYAYIIPFNEKQENGQYLVKAQFQIGYKGYIQLAMRSGQFKTIHSTDVRKDEILSQDRLSGTIEFDWIEDDLVRDKVDVIGYVAYFKLINGYEATLYMPLDKLDNHGKKFSQTYKRNFGLWKDDFDSMAKKTVLKLLLSKYAPMSIDMVKAKEVDQASVEWNEEEKDFKETYIDAVEVKTNPIDERILILLNDAKTQDDLDYIKGLPEAQTEEYLSIIKGKQIELNKKNKKNA